MSQTRFSMPVRREHLINEYRGASDAAFAAVEQSEYFSSHARIAKANTDLRDEKDLWDAASHHLVNAIKHREHELLCRREEYRLYKQYMSELETRVQKSIMAYCRRRIYRMRRWEREQLECKASLVQLRINIHRVQQALGMAEEDRTAFRQDIRLNGSGRAHVESFGAGWDRQGGSGSSSYGYKPRATNDAWTLRKMDYSISKMNSRIKSQQIEEELRLKAWADAKDGLEAFKEEWRDRDNAARALLLAFEKATNPAGMASSTASAFGTRARIPRPVDDDDSWGEDLDRALAAELDADVYMSGSDRPSQQLPHNLLSPTPDDVHEAAFQYAGMQLRDDMYSTLSSGGMDSGYESGPGAIGTGPGKPSQHKPSASSSRSGAASNLSYQTTVSHGWEEPVESVSIEAGWQAAFDAVSVGEQEGGGATPSAAAAASSRTPRASGAGESIAGGNDWEFAYGQEEEL